MNIEVKIKQLSNGQFQATSPKLNIHAFGNSKAKALVRLKLIINFYSDTAKEMGGSLLDLDFSNNNFKAPQATATNVN